MIREITTRPSSGWSCLVILLLLIAVNAVVAFFGFVLGQTSPGYLGPAVVLTIAGLVFGLASLICLGGFFTLEPNEACVLSFFGPYKGKVRESGFFWVNPFYTKRKISLKARNFEGAKLKVNDKTRNPIEIAAVVVWHVADTAQACFDVENYDDYVKVQSESALRHLANSYAYDHGEEHEITLRSSVEEVSTALRAELGERLSKAGVAVSEARLSHLAYAPEIANVMLRRQQADAVIAARQKIVHGAVTMVEMALNQLDERKIVAMSEDRKAALVSNLLVVLCSESEAQPMINAGAAAG